MSQNRPKSRSTRNKKRPKGSGTFGITKDGLHYYRLSVAGVRRTVYGQAHDIAQRAVSLQQEMASPQAPTLEITGSVGDLLDRYLAYLTHADIPGQTERGTRSALKTHIRPQIGHLPLARLEQRHVQQLVDTMLQSGSSPNAILYVVGRLRKVLSWAVERRELGVNAADGIRVPSRRRRPVTTLSRAETGILLQTSTQDFWHPAWRLLLDSGIRIGEFLGLEQDGVDWDRGVIDIHQQRDGSAIVPLKTARAYRRITLAPSTITALTSWRRESGLLIQVWDETVNKALKRALTTAGLPTEGRTIHTLRHTCATLLLDAGINVRVVSDRLGHANIQTTLSLYSHAMPSMEAQAQVVMDRILDSTS